MGLSEDMAKAIANNFRVEFSKRIDVDKEWTVWQDALQEAGLNDENAEHYYRAFAKSWTKTSFQPSLHHFCNWVRANCGSVYSQEERWRGSVECAYCHDSSMVDVPIPSIWSEDRGLILQWPEGFIPGEPWDQCQEVYSVCLPCVCLKGQKKQEKQAMSERAIWMRDKTVEWYASYKDGAALALNRYRADCYRRFMEAHPVVEKERDMRAEAATRQPVLIKTLAERARRKKQVVRNGGEGAKLHAGAVEGQDREAQEALRDVPDDEIPF